MSLSDEITSKPVCELSDAVLEFVFALQRNPELLKAVQRPESVRGALERMVDANVLVMNRRIEADQRQRAEQAELLPFPGEGDGPERRGGAPEEGAKD